MELLIVFFKVIGFFVLLLAMSFVFGGVVALICWIYNEFFGGFGEKDND